MAEGHADASIALDADKTCMVQEKGPWTAFYCGGDANPMGCQGEPEDLVPTVCFPAFPKADCTTGTVNPVAGERRRLQLRL